MTTLTRHIVLAERVPDALAGQRVDQVAAQLFPNYSRSRLTDWIKQGYVTVDGQACKPKASVRGGEWLRVDTHETAASDDVAQQIAFDVLYEDASLIIINKPAGLVVHPGAGNMDQTLVNGLLHFDPTLRALPRAGIVHRLDKDTSGCLVIARSLDVHHALVEALAEREMGREYEAIVHGTPVAGGLIDVPLDRSHSNRLKIAVSESGRPARTHFRVHERYRAHALLRLKLDTGRTHQIRVHLQYAGFPIVGDPLYSGRFRKPAGASTALLDALAGFKRQALHAFRLKLMHPVSQKEITVTAPAPSDFLALVQVMQNDAAAIDASDFE